MPWLILAPFFFSGSVLLLAFLAFMLGSSSYTSAGHETQNIASSGYYLLEASSVKITSNNNTLTKLSSPWGGSLHERQRLAWPIVRRLSERENLDPALVMALVQVESRFNPSVVSNRGAAGLMQINPVTARHLGLADPMNPEANLAAGIRYLSKLHKMFDNDIRLVLAAYNAGPGRVQAAGGVVPPIKETVAFVDKVLNQTDHFRSRFQ